MCDADASVGRRAGRGVLEREFEPRRAGVGEGRGRRVETAAPCPAAAPSCSGRAPVSRHADGSKGLSGVAPGVTAVPRRVLCQVLHHQIEVGIIVGRTAMEQLPNAFEAELKRLASQIIVRLLLAPAASPAKIAVRRQRCVVPIRNMALLFNLFRQLQP